MDHIRDAQLPDAYTNEMASDFVQLRCGDENLSLFRRSTFSTALFRPRGPKSQRIKDAPGLA